jgi:ADP-dependent NAD(P)H-hydrate dehydratase / NAD(P)H-hydrate epimerase
MSVAPARLLDADLAASLLPVRDPRGHKGTFGRVSVVAGSLDFAGAALMSGAAALRAGSGLVTLWLPASLQPILAGRIPELITRGMPERSAGEIDAAASADSILACACDALLVGPGVAPGPGSGGLVQRLLAADGPPAVVDAGALDALSGIPGWAGRVRRPCVLTPHPGELQRLGRVPGSTDEVRLPAAQAAAATWGQIVVLKGAHTVIAEPGGRTLLAPFSLPLLGTAGSGDVLAGVIVSFIGQGLAAFEAAALGVYLHARAAERLGGELGDAGLLATDLLDQIPRARRALRDRHTDEQPGPDEARGG